MKTIKRVVMYLLIFRSVSRGCSVGRAKRWKRRVYRNLKWDKEHSLKEKIWAYRHGYLPEYVSRFGIDSTNVDKYISERDYYYLQPINGIYRKWLSNKVVTRKVFSKFSEHLQKLYYQFSKLNEEIRVTILDDCPYETQEISDVIRLIKEEGILVATSPSRNSSKIIEFKNNSFYFDGRIMADDEELINEIQNYSRNAIIAEYVRPGEAFRNNITEFGNVVRLIVYNSKGYSPVISEAFIRKDDFFTDDKDALEEKINEFYGTDYKFNDYVADNISKGSNDEDDDEGDSEEEIKYFRGIISYIDVDTGSYSGGKIIIGDNVIECRTNFNTNEIIEGKIDCWSEIKTTVEDLSRHTPQLEFFAVDVLITEEGFKLVRFANVPKYPAAQMFKEDTATFLNKKLQEKKALYSGFGPRFRRGIKRIKLKSRRVFAAAFFPKGLKPYLSLRWMKEVLIDFFTNRDTSLTTKIWAYRHGFLSYRIPQYGITKENHLNYISDFEYKWLRHINGRFRVMFEDKITIKYIVNDFKECFPDYYYHIKTDNDENIIIPMMDCPDDYGNSIEDIIRLAKEKGVLALKPDEGSHGDGFYKLSYQNGMFYLNFDEAEEKDVVDILMNPDNQYLVTEYINNHPQFKAIYDGAVNTIRMIVFKKDGITPQIGNAYMRFGSKQTGAVDNMGAGGMFVQVDVDTGRYYNAKIITHNSIQDCPYHPDTGVLMEGIIPHWEQVKSTVLAVAASIHQLEYFGFDIAVTEDGIKFPEINRFPDYPKIEQLSPVTMDYLLHKLEQKKHKYGYDVKPCRKLVHLPKR